MKSYCLYALVLLLVLPVPVSHAQKTAEEPSKTVETLDSVQFFISKGNSDTVLPASRSALMRKAFRHAQKINEDSIKIKAFTELSYVLSRPGDSLCFRESNRTLIALAKKLNDTVRLAEAFWDLSYFLERMEVTDSAYYNYSQAQKLYQLKKDTLSSARMLINMALQQEKVKDYVGSETNIVMAIEALKPLKQNRYLYESYNQLGIIAKDLGEYEKAINYFNEAIVYSNKLQTKEQYLPRTINNIGVVYQGKKDYQKSVESFNTVLQIDDLKALNTELYAMVLNNLALSKIKLKDTLGTKALINESFNLKDKSGLDGSLAPIYSTLAEYHLFKQDTLGAIAAARQAKNIAKRSNNNLRLLETLAFLTKVDRANASAHGQAYIRLNDSLQTEERRARNKFARIRFETDELSAENEVLSEEKEILSEEKELLSKQNQIWAALAAGFFLFALAIYIIVNQRTKNQKLRFQQQQQFSNQEIFNLMLAQKQKVDEVKRMEQKRISEELHDGVLGKMLGARMVLTGLNKKGTEQAIHERSEAIVALRNIENELRAISHELSHTAYRKINNFVNSIETLLSSATHKTSIRTVFNYDEDADWDFLIGDIKINVYRIIQENIQNAIKHSGCSNFFVNFEIKGDLYIVTIGDDGKGFSFDREQKGIGLRNIKSRVKKMRGSLNVKTGLGNGTEMTLEIPTQYSNPVIDDSIN